MTDIIIVWVLPNSIFILTDTPFRTQWILWPMIVLVYFVIGNGALGTTWGKHLTGLKLTGSGCLLCRELRKLWPVILIFLGGCLHLAYPSNLANATIAAGCLASAAHITIALIYPLPYWDRTTGFQVTDHAPSS